MVRTRAAARAPCNVCALTLIGETGTICTVCDRQCHTRCAYVRKYETKCVTCTNKTRAAESKAQRECDAIIPYALVTCCVILIIWICAPLFKHLLTAPLKAQ